MDQDPETDIAATLREIAANSDEITGKILKKCNKAAAKGLSHITVDILEEDYQYLNRKNLQYAKKEWGVAPPYVEKLESLGFKLEVDRKESGWSKFVGFLNGYSRESYSYCMTVRW